jgi:hypothetical protein
MRNLIRSAGKLSSPAILIVVVWCVTLVGVAIGPIAYPMQPSPVVLAIVVTGVFLFVSAYRAGGWCFDNWCQRQARIPAPSTRTLNRVVTATSLIGIAGIGLVALDRTTFSGISNSGYSELMRCAPGLVDSIAIKRTPLLYLGYLTFSFGFVSVMLFVLKGEEIRRWVAVLAQLSILSPVGYALIYSGRMPILLVLVLVVSAMLVRMGRGQRPWPGGYHLLLKTAFAIGLFAIYSSSIWSSRRDFCNQMSGLIHELQQEQNGRNLQKEQDLDGAGGQTSRPKPAAAITATDLNKRLAEAQAALAPAVSPNSTTTALMLLPEAWNVKPRGYVTSAIESGHLSPRAAIIVLSSYFYLTHGIRTIDIAWRARDRFTPQWGIYEIGVLSPLLRVFFPDSALVAGMEGQQRAAQIYGFFPTVWGAAFIDFGLGGAVIYVLTWGFVAGWSAFGVRHSTLITPSLLLVFVLASIFLSSLQGPLGIANSALVLFSLLATGIAADSVSLRSGSGRVTGELQLKRSIS